MSLSFEDVEREAEELMANIPRSVLNRIHDQKDHVIKWVSVRQASTDYVGMHLVKAWKKTNEHWIEVNIADAVEEMASFLKDKVSTKTIIKEVLLKLNLPDFTELQERIKKKPKVTVGIQKGSCVYLYIRGKRGPVFSLQLTE